MKNVFLQIQGAEMAFVNASLILSEILKTFAFRKQLMKVRISVFMLVFFEFFLIKILKLILNIKCRT